MIAANQLPEKRSVYEAPPLLPGQELTPEQEQQNTTAQIASIVLGVAAAKSGLQTATTNQIVALLHAANLVTEAGVKAFAASAAALVRLASRQAQELTWTATKMRAEIMDVQFDAPMPDEEDIEPSLRYGRNTTLERAYERVATEYRDNMKRTKDDPVIQELVAQMEAEMLTPTPRPDNLSSDAVERIANGKAEWQKAFEEALQDEGREDPEGPSDEEVARVSLAERRAQARERQAKELEAIVSDAKRVREESRKQQATRDDADAEGFAGAPEETATLRLTDGEIDVIIERYAEQKAGERVERMVSQDVAGASRNMYSIALDSIKDKKVIGYRRVVHPELSESGHSCGLCIVASTMKYTKRDLLPIHSGCNCETVEIYSVDGDIYDPGHMINMEDLSVFYREAGESTHGWDLKKSRYEVVDHPEYGPTLVNAHPNKRGKMKKEYVPANV